MGRREEGEGGGERKKQPNQPLAEVGETQRKFVQYSGILIFLPSVFFFLGGLKFEAKILIITWW